MQAAGKSSTLKDSCWNLFAGPRRFHLAFLVIAVWLCGMCVVSLSSLSRRTLRDTDVWSPYTLPQEIDVPIARVFRVDKMRIFAPGASIPVSGRNKTSAILASTQTYNEKIVSPVIADRAILKEKKDNKAHLSTSVSKRNNNFKTGESIPISKGHKMFRMLVSNPNSTRENFPTSQTSNLTFKREEDPKALVSSLTSEPVSTKDGICHFPEVDPFDPTLDQYLKRHPPLQCSSNVPNVVHLFNEKLIVDKEKVKEALGKTRSEGELGFCQYKVLMRSESDVDADIVSISDPFNTSIKLNGTEEDIKVECYDTDDYVISRSYFSVLRVDPEKQKVYNEWYKAHVTEHSPAETLSILMLGIDGLAKQHFVRAMPKTRDFLIKELGGLEMNKHSKLAYSTFPNIIPLLTGRTIKELETDPTWMFQRYGRMDQINEAFIWSHARYLGYRTGLMLDYVDWTAFHYQRRGFKHRPVDHYMRALVVDSTKDKLMRDNLHCYGDEPEVSKLYDYWLQLLHHYNSTKSNQTPFFAYSFLNRLTHDDYNMAFAGDELYLKFLQDLKTSKALNNTVIILFSDHGERFGALRDTFTGEVETNTPLLFFVFPPWFEKKYRHVMRVFRTNQNRLTSFYDIHATILDILYFKGIVGPKGNLGERAISLFREIPQHRTCKDAQIPAEYCLCAGLCLAKLPPGLGTYLGRVVTDNVMSLLDKNMSVCAELTLKSVVRVLEQTDLGNGSKSGIRNFRVSIKTVPGRARFEARVRFHTETGRAEVDGEVARTNMYRGQADCMDIAELRNYCYCKDLLSKKAS